MGKYIPTKMASRKTVVEEGGGEVGNRLLRKATSGSEVPVAARTLKKKNSQRGPKVGMV